MQITINNTVVTIAQDSLSIDDAIGERSTCSFVVIDDIGVNYSKGQPVEILDNMYYLLTMKNGVYYSPSTWAEWSKSAGVVGDATGIDLPTDSHSIVMTGCSFKPSTNYGILYNVVSSTLTANDFYVFGGGAGYSFPTSVVAPRVVGNNKVVQSTGASITYNEFLFFALGSAGKSIKLKDIRVLELPTSSQIETDFTNLTADQLNAKYPFGNIEIMFGVGNTPTKAEADAIYASDGTPYWEGFRDVLYGTEMIYAGYIDKAGEKKVSGNANIGYTKFHTISCADMHYLSDKRIIAKAYSNVTAGYIVEDLITEKLADEGVTIGNVEDGALVIEAVFNYITVTKAIESLAEKANFIWYIDYDKKLYFMPRSTFIAPWTATGEDMRDGSVSVEHGNSAYRNTQYVKGGKDITDALTENKIGDGATRSWVVGFSVALEPTITLNAVAIAASDVGIRSVEKDKKYYWSKGSNTINQAETETLLISSDVLAITYRGEFDIIVKTLNETEIDSKLVTEGGTTGIVEDVADEPNSTTREAAFEIANAKLEKYGVIGRRLKFRTSRYGLWAGQILPVSLPEHDITADLLIESVTISTEQNVLTWYDVTCAEGPEQQSWTKMFEAMATRGQAFVVRENISEDSVLITLQTFTKTWLEATATNIFRTMYPSATLYPGATQYPMLEETERVLYMELLTAADVVLIRKQITKQTGTTTLSSVTFIAPFEAVGEIAKVRWYGGPTATITNGSGILVDEQAWANTKTTLEALQIDKTDTKGF